MGYGLGQGSFFAWNIVISYERFQVQGQGMFGGVPPVSCSTTPTSNGINLTTYLLVLLKFFLKLFDAIVTFLDVLLKLFVVPSCFLMPSLNCTMSASCFLIIAMKSSLIWPNAARHG